MRTLYVLMAMVLVGGLLTSCQKIGVGGMLAQWSGSWAKVNVPPDCVPKQIAGEESNGVIVLCEDGRIFH